MWIYPSAVCLLYTSYKNEENLKKFGRLDSYEPQIYPHSSASGKKQDRNYEYAANSVEYIFIFFYKMIILCKLEANLTAYESQYGKNEML